ncbi:MAG: NAD-dependent DNA ligase LigA [Defluviitaleaceae bacterium]|nr:NAD-dependent DNA ligase LigA [Defluviitaleaceae bacterium]
MNERIYELVELLNRANYAYEQENSPIMTDFEYDKLYDELIELESKTGFILENSPSQNAGHEIVSNLVKVKHDVALLSLNKTKDADDLAEFLNNDGETKDGILSWKLDGLTIILRYANGELLQGLTRGNGEIGEDITHNAKFLRNIPRSIDFKGELTVRGEAIIRLGEFERINEQLEDDEKYKNPRNLCSGSMRQLNSRIAAGRNIDFFAFAILGVVGMDFLKKSEHLEFLEKLGFELAAYLQVDESNVKAAVENFKAKVETEDFATDGLVLTYNDIEFSESLGKTSKFPRDSLAFKWADELRQSRLLDIQWHTSRTGLINPIAIFEPIELEGTIVARASLHNLSIVEKLELGIGDTIEVYKANMIIPQIAANLTKSKTVLPPSICAVCSTNVVIRETNDVKTLHCPNPNCRARLIFTISHYAGRNGMNIEGFSKQTIEKFLEMGFLENCSDIYELERYKEEIIALVGFGERSYNKLIDSVETSKTAKLANFIYALGIDNVGLSNAKLLCRHFDYDIERIINASYEDFAAIEGFGDIIAESLINFFAANIEFLNKIMSYLKLEGEIISEGTFSGKTFVITGDLQHYRNRKAMSAVIEAKGGKIAGSISKNTDFLVNNNPASQSSKNKKAKELNIPIITENEFIGMLDNFNEE